MSEQIKNGVGKKENIFTVRDLHCAIQSLDMDDRVYAQLVAADGATFALCGFFAAAFFVLGAIHDS